MSGKSVLLSLLRDVRGISFSDEIVYLFDLFAGITLRRLGMKEILPGHLIFKDVIVKVKTRENCLFYCPARTDALLHVLPYYEEKTLKLMRSILKPGDVFIDVGAHIGSYTIPMARIVGSHGLVIAIEPSPLHKVLLKNIYLNNLKNVIVCKKAAYSKTTKLRFHYNPKKTGISHLSNKDLELEVDTSTLDDIIRDVVNYPIKRIKLIKIDVEGAEAEVLRGAMYTLKNTEYIIFEARKETLNECIELLSDEFKINFIESVTTGSVYNLIARRRRLKG